MTVAHEDQFGSVRFKGKRSEYYMIYNKFQIIEPKQEFHNIPLERVRQLLNTMRFEVADVRTNQLLRRFLPEEVKNDLKDKRKGEACFIIGGGPSLEGFNFNRLDEFFTIAVNHSIEHYPKAAAVLFGDAVFLQRTSFDLKGYAGMIFCSVASGYSNSDPRDNVYCFRFQRQAVQADFSQGLLFTMLSGTAAINAAIIMGCSPIVLLGFDLYTREDGNNHYYQDIKGQRQPTGTYSSKVDHFEKFRPWVDRIINCSEKSLITTFRKKSIDEVLAWLK